MSPNIKSRHTLFKARLRKKADRHKLAGKSSASTHAKHKHNSSGLARLWDLGLQSGMSIAPAHPYSYSALATERTIRVVVLVPETDFNAPLQCCLEHIEVEDSAEPGKEYEAVSYCWGEAIFSCELLCDGRSLRINPNVDSLLRHLRRSDVPQRFWIDGICINQQDLDEKSSQISLMRDIYFCALRVHVWLGDVVASDAEAFIAIRKLVFLDKSTRKLTRREVDRYLNCTTGKSLESIATLLARPWFTRRWILQEIGLSHETVLHCGYLSINNSFLLPGLKLLKARIDNHPISVPSTLNGLLLQAISVCGCSPLDKPVAELLISYRSSKCADERDAIFALLALGANDLIEPHYKREWLGMSAFKPSYNLSTVEIYTRFALHCIHSGYYAQILCMAMCFPCEGALTWVPDMRLAGEAKGFRGTEFMLCSNLLTSSWPKIRKSREGMRAGNAFSGLKSRTIPTADRTGFWLAPDIPHTAHEIQWVGDLLPELHSRDLVVATLRQWLSPFVMESVCEHSEPFGFRNGRILQERYLCQCDEAQHCRALVQDPLASSQTSSEESAGMRHHLERCVLVREVVGPTNGMQLPSSRSFKWQSLAEAKRVHERAEDEIYINASILALDRPGLISLEILSLFLGTISAISRTDAAPSLSAKGCAEWFGIAIPQRLGLLQLLTSYFGGISASIFQAWKPLFVGRGEQTRGRSKKSNDNFSGQADCTDQTCASLRNLGSARMCVLSERKACWNRDLPSGHHGNRDGFREGTMLVLCPQATQEGDIFVVLKVAHQDRDRPARRFGSHRSAPSAPGSDLADTSDQSEESDEEDSHVHFVPRRYDYLSLVLTPSGRQSALPTSLKNNDSLCQELEGIEGHRILGDGFVPYLYWGLYSSQAQILINA